MNAKQAKVIVDLTDIFTNGDIPDVDTIFVHLGTWDTRVSLAVMQNTFPILKIGYFPPDVDCDYVFVVGKLSEDSPILFEARVLKTELQEITTETKSFVIPVPEPVSSVQ
jgi:hypothetical protein